MLSSASVVAVVATTDLDRANQFYGETLGLQQADESMPGPGATLFRGGNGTTVLVYERPTAGDSEATILNFRVDDVEGEVDRLRDAGVEFEDYDLEQMQIKTENGIASFGDFRAAWFKDPDGNILCVSN